MHREKRSKKMEDLVSDISQRMKGYQSIPSILADRALKIGALSFFVLFSGSYMGRQTDSPWFYPVVCGNLRLRPVVFLPAALPRGKEGL